MGIPKLLLATVTIAIALLVPAASLAATTYSDAIHGGEYFATSTDGRFAGSASGSLPGSWNADVQHTALCISCSTTATITGGSFQLATTLTSVPTLITGNFDGGTVSVTDPGTGCKNQTFAVDGKLSNVGPWYTGTGTGTFTATLTHYRYQLFGSCITYSASVTGTLVLDF
jgi:hypothetical protein